MSKRGRYRENARREAKKRITGGGRSYESRASSGAACSTHLDRPESTTAGVGEELEQEQVMFEDRVCGEFERIFPPQRSLSDRMEAYEALIDVATSDFFGKRKSSAKAAPLPPPAIKVAFDVAALGIADIVATAQRASAVDASAGGEKFGGGGGGAGANSDGQLVSKDTKGAIKQDKKEKENDPDVIIADSWAVWQNGSGGGGGGGGGSGGAKGKGRGSAVFRSKFERLPSKKKLSAKKSTTSLAATSALAKLGTLEFDCGEVVNVDDLEMLKAAPPYSKLRQFYFKSLDWPGRAVSKIATPTGIQFTRGAPRYHHGYLLCRFMLTCAASFSNLIYDVSPLSNLYRQCSNL